MTSLLGKLARRAATMIPALRRVVSERDLLRQALSDCQRQLQEMSNHQKQVRDCATPGHFYSPLPCVEEVLRGPDRVWAPPPAALPAIDLRTDQQLALLEEFAASYYKDLPFTAQPQPHLRYYLDNPSYSYGDAIFLYSMIRHLRPSRIIEVGSGFSSALIMDTNDLHFEGKIALTFIDPEPQRLRSLMRPGDESRHVILPVRVQDCDIEAFSALGQNDILFIDSSHVSKIDSDLNHLMFEVLPRLRDGVHVHFHDIYYPFDYPHACLLEGMFWNESYLLRAFLEFNPAFQIVIHNHYLYRRFGSRLHSLLPLTLNNPGGSLWIAKRPVTTDD